MFRATCPVECLYCLAVQIDSRRSKWEKKHRWGINKSVLFLNRLPQDEPVSEMQIDVDLLAGEYLGFQGITDPFWPIFTDDLKFLVNLVQTSRIRKLILSTKWAATYEQLQILSESNKTALIVSITGLDMLEKTKTKDRLSVIEKAVKLGIDVLPLIHPYIHGLSDLSFLPELPNIGVNKVAVKGFRFNEKNMGEWGRKLIPPEYYLVYKNAEEQEILLGYEFVKEQFNIYGLQEVSFREWAHKPNGVPGVSRQEAEKAVDTILPYCVITSSDPENVREFAILRRL